MIGKPARRRKRLNAVEDLSEKEKYTELKRRAKNIKEWLGLKRAASHIPASQQITGS